MTFYKSNARWLFGGFLLCFFSAFGQTFFISIWGREIRSEFALTVGEFGQVYMIATLASALVFPTVGRLVDRFSPARCASIVIVCLAFAAALMAFAQGVIALITTIFLLRLFGQGMMGHTAITAMGRWYSANRGKAVSAATIGHQVSEAIVPITVVSLGLIIGWRNTWLAASILLILIAFPLVYSLLSRERTPSQSRAEASGGSAAHPQWTRAAVMRDPYFWLLCSGVLSPAFIGTAIWFHQDYLIELNGWSKETWALSFAVMATTTICGSLLTGAMIDRFSAIQLLPLFMVPLAIACVLLAAFSDPAAIFVTMFFIGLSYGISSALFGALWPEIYGTQHLGSIRSLVMAFMVFFSAAGPGVTGSLIDWGYPFPTQLWMIGVYCAVSAGLMYFLSGRLFQRRIRECHGSFKG